MRNIAMRALVLAVALALPTAARADEKIMIFGGAGHRTYLGCLSCSKYDYDSVFNEFGPNGSKFSSESIHNHFSEYGSKFSMYSACSKYASDPPVMVDKKGGFYGRLTLNRFHPDATKVDTILGWLLAVCND